MVGEAAGLQGGHAGGQRRQPRHAHRDFGTGSITRFADHGTQQVRFTLQLTEAGAAGQVFTLYVPVEAYGQAGELAGDLAAGAAVLVTGKLKWTAWTDKHGQKRTSLCVLARFIKRLASTAGAALA